MTSCVVVDGQAFNFVDDWGVVVTYYFRDTYFAVSGPRLWAIRAQCSRPDSEHRLLSVSGLRALDEDCGCEGR